MKNKNQKILVTGKSGFVGSRLMEIFSSRYNIMTLSLKDPRIIDTSDFSGVDAIVHLAGKAHEMQAIDESLYYRVNFELTRLLAEKAIREKVPHFIYISSTKVYGDFIGETLDETSACVPSDPYGKSKLMAESWLMEHSTNDFKVAVIRPPLIYGPGVKGNMIRLLKICDKNFYLPFRNVRNSRSIVYLDNFLALIETILIQKAEGTYIAGDAVPLSTAEMVRLIRTAMGKPPKLFSLPGQLLLLVRRLKPSLYERLFGSFVVDNTTTNQKLNFTPPYSSAYGMAEMVKWYQK